MKSQCKLVQVPVWCDRLSTEHGYSLASFEDGFAAEEFGKNAADGPYVDGRRLDGGTNSKVLQSSDRSPTHVICKTQHDFRGAIPARCYVFGHEPTLMRISLGWSLEASCKAKITNFELAVSIDEQISGLKISVDNVSRMDIL